MQRVKLVTALQLYVVSATFWIVDLPPEEEDNGLVLDTQEHKFYYPIFFPSYAEAESFAEQGTWADDYFKQSERNVNLLFLTHPKRAENAQKTEEIFSAFYRLWKFPKYNELWGASDIKFVRSNGTELMTPTTRGIEQVLIKKDPTESSKFYFKEICKCQTTGQINSVISLEDYLKEGWVLWNESGSCTESDFMKLKHHWAIEIRSEKELFPNLSPS